jgi:hypothetical protein
MENWTSIYLLSIAENLGKTLSVASNMFLLAGVVAYIVSVLRHWWWLDTHRDEEKENADYLISEPKVRKFSITCGVLSAGFALLSGLCPTTENVLKAYALVEGSKVINAPNAELAAEAVGKRFDRFLDIVDRGINGRRETPVAAPPEKK